ncbi:protein starmaker-like isoform X2 [Limulus polyphemus]|uniref:Protein starmaker-like isoform X2 n=1 Tax=Limulus polyphemus TaxID=6850 RepID=A0ABM1TD35_LIMPO|nr:protein starmaker-like isoform X2 [Limulus polyphemus]
MAQRGFGGSPWQQSGPNFVENQMRLGLGSLVDLMNMERLMRESGGGFGGGIGFGLNTGGMDMSQMMGFLESRSRNERVGGYERGNQRNRMRGRNRSGNRRNQTRRRSRKQQSPGEGQQKRSAQQQSPRGGQKKRQIQQQGPGESSHPKRQNTDEAQNSPQEKNGRNVKENEYPYSPANPTSEGTEQRFQTQVNGKNQNLSMDQQAKSKVKVANKMRRRKGQDRNTFYCTVCEREYHGSFLQHRRTSKEHRKNRDRKYPKCRLCRKSFNSPLELKQHHKTTNHKNLTKRPGEKNATKSDDDTDYVTLDATGIFEDENKKEVTQCNQDTDSEREENVDELKDEDDDDDDKPVGQVYVVKVEGFFCKICHKFFKDSHSATITHCKSEEHRKNNAKIQEMIKKRKALEAQRKVVEEARVQDGEEAKKTADDISKEEETQEQQISTTDEQGADVEDEKVDNKQETDMERNEEAENDHEMTEEQGTVAGSEEEKSIDKPKKDKEESEKTEQCKITVSFKDEKQGECDEEKEKLVSSELDDILGPVDNLQSSSQENEDDELVSSLVSENREQENSELFASLSSQIVSKELETKLNLQEVVEDEGEEEDGDDADTSKEINLPSAATRSQGKARGRGRGRGRGKRNS